MNMNELRTRGVRLVVFVSVGIAASTRLPAAPEVGFNRDVVPILATYCFECHGPDAAQRKAELRLDDLISATSPLPSGTVAIVPGNPQASELVRRLRADEVERMPPVESGESLAEDDIALLEQWILEGAQWKGPWAFEPLDLRPLPVASNGTIRRHAVDAFIHSQLDDLGLEPAGAASRTVLIRRLTYDLWGLPPTPRQVDAFLRDDRPDAYERLVDRLLASPRYGERWGRHWLDVARYADSNGGDENHAYPLAHRYRDYVVQAVNEDIGYDEFIREQLAGDLLPKSDDAVRDARRITATGYLAIGMKILAEQDPVKKRADMVDEQLDTFGRTFLGLSLGCARCHDHKFDPIETRDYYALAGIFHSSAVQDRPLPSPEFRLQLAEYEARVQQLKDRLAKTTALFESTDGVQTWEAESFQRGNVVVDHDHYGEGIGIISDPGGQRNYVEYDVVVPATSSFALLLRYAAKAPRPGQITLNGNVVNNEALSKTTGGWMPADQRWHFEGLVTLRRGTNVLRIESEPMMSHLDKLRLLPGDQTKRAEWESLRQLEDQLAAAEKESPQPTQVMAIADENVHNSKIHLRGSHLELGEEVPRRFLAVLDGVRNEIPPNESGRLQLARWLTNNAVAARLTSRVMANRLWHWHFGRGLVATPDDFGRRGERPTHPRLLDYLARRLIESQWSWKVMHREIVTSETYRRSARHPRDPVMAAIDPTNLRYWKRPRQRLDAESIRDGMLLHAGQLDLTMGQAPMIVKSQDPSPEDMQNNLAIYEQSRRRSVYLPIVRSNVYEFLTLFDFPNAATPVGKRNRTTIPTQSLWMMNGPFMARVAQQVAARQPANAAPVEKVQSVYRQLFGREPTRRELHEAHQFFESMSSDIGEPTPNHATAWTLYCQVLLMSNESIYLD